ncbi:MAG: hypothetical protein L0Y66_01545 [Myxococcaceae bacterium]|nr:hypothetical protein [Myxococcaceae bacterium]MCI0672567.1 hypothetical protein [Myxococcaceae bacterium]
MRTSPRHVIEQHNLLGGTDVVTPVTGRTQSPRVVHVRHQARAGFAAALALVVEYGKKALEEQDVPTRTRCPRCGCVGDTQRDFGVRRMDGQVRAQSWCRTCRNQKVATAPGAQTGWLFAG